MIKISRDLGKQICLQLKKLPYNDVIQLIEELEDKIYPNKYNGITYLGGDLTPVYDEWDDEIDTEIKCENKRFKVGYIK